MENNIFNPSFRIEKKTKAFNKYIWCFVCTISVFTVSVFLGAFIYAFMSSYLNIVNYYIPLSFIIFIPIILFIILAYQYVLFLRALLTSYKIENGNLIKGRILNKDKVDASDIAISSALVMDGAKNLGKGSKTMHANTANNLYNIFKLIECNLKSEFVNKYFDTSLYKKIEYRNAKLVNETKYCLIYTSDNKKKIVIPKIYNGMFNIENSKEVSFIKRIIKKSIYVFLVSLICIVCLLFVQSKINVNHLNNILSASDTILQKLDDYGYRISRNNVDYYVYSKELDNKKTSYINYKFKSDGSIKKVDFQLFYNSDSNDVENELRTILDSVNYQFDKEEKETFIENVINGINGNYVYDKLPFGKFSIIIGRSEGYIDIHNTIFN